MCSRLLSTFMIKYSNSNMNYLDTSQFIKRQFLLNQTVLIRQFLLNLQDVKSNITSSKKTVSMARLEMCRAFSKVSFLCSSSISVGGGSGRGVGG